ncbi:MAG: hypothetical protein P8K80_10210 [Phycisphaerales bacterium]|nr:hypothetical protein [Phycisphaerales bacterium]
MQYTHTPASLLALIILASPVAAAIEEENLLLLYNSQVPVSLAIRDAYIAHHPGVHQFDLDLSYPVADESWPDSTPPPEGMTNYYITSAKFTELFVDDAGDFQQYLTANPEVVAIATTRGLPAAITDNFDPPVNHAAPSPDMWGSFESHLCRSATGIFKWQDETDTDTQNLYRGSERPFLEELAECEDGGICPGDLHLVTRLDSGRGSVDVDGDGVKTPLDGVLAMIERCVEPIPVNTYATTMIYDDNPTDDDPDFGEWCTHPINFYHNFLGAMISFRRGNFCQILDRSAQFLHGPNDNAFDPATDADAQAYPILSLVTMGRNHCGSTTNPDEPVNADYIRRYEAHPAGWFTSIESYNGRSLHQFNASPGGHGQALDWIGYSNGSFATGHVQGVTTGEFSATYIGMRNFYQSGFSWAEAVYTTLGTGGYTTPIGDPLGRVRLVKPDINLDFVVDDLDRAYVVHQLGTPGPEGDIDGNGIVDEVDLAELDAAFGRARPNMELDPVVSTSACGDVTRDGIVDIEDILGLISQWGDCSPFDDCTADTNGDDLVEINDLLLIISRWGWMAGDLNGNLLVDIDDLLLIIYAMDAVPGDPQWNDGADTDCSGLIDVKDYMYVIAQIEGF